MIKFNYFFSFLFVAISCTAHETILKHSEFGKGVQQELDTALWSMPAEERGRFDRRGGSFENTSPLSKGQEVYCDSVFRAVARKIIAGEKVPNSVDYIIFGRCPKPEKDPVFRALAVPHRIGEVSRFIENKEKEVKEYAREAAQNKKLEVKLSELEKWLSQLRDSVVNSGDGRVLDDGEMKKFVEEFRCEGVSDGLFIRDTYYKSTLCKLDEDVARKTKEYESMVSSPLVFANDKARDNYNLEVELQKQRVADAKKRRDKYFRERCDLVSKVFAIIAASPENLDRFNSGIGKCYIFSYWNLITDGPFAGLKEFKGKGTFDVLIAEADKCQKGGMCSVDKTFLRSLKKFADVWAEYREVKLELEDYRKNRAERYAKTKAELDRWIEEKKKLEVQLKQHVEELKKMYSESQ